MPPESDSNGLSGHNLERFRQAQDAIYQQVLAELRAGAKRSHWMWFIFPQVAGLGYSSTSQYYALGSRDEAQAFLADPVLGARLLECTGAVLAVQGKSALDIFGGIDELKFRSSMTLFAMLAGPDSLYQQVLDKYFKGKPDQRTIELLDRM